MHEGGETVTARQGANGGLRVGSAGPGSLADLAGRAKGARGRPLDSWDPPFCGDLDLRIDRAGHWFYMGTPVARPALVALFASILRREPDGRHYLVTPVEKVRIAVEDAPFLAVELRTEGAGDAQVIGLRTNLDQWFVAGPEHPIRFAVDKATQGLKPYVGLDHGLEALLARPLVSELLDCAQERVIGGRRTLGIISASAFFEVPVGEGGA